MKTYISILRGINVSGKNIIKMDVLKKLFESLDFQNVITYVQSGNVVFTSTIIDNKQIQQQIQSKIKNELKLQVPVLVLSKEDWEYCIEQNPFKDKDHSFLHYTFLEEKPSDVKKEIILSKKTDQEAIEFSDRVVYLYCPNGYGITKLSNTFLEKTLKVTATTRNFKTTQELLRLAEREIMV